MQITELVSTVLFCVFLEIRERFLVVLQMIETVGLRQNALCIVGVDGNGIFTTCDRSTIVLTHELRIGKSIPIYLGVGVMIQQFVK